MMIGRWPARAPGAIEKLMMFSLSVTGPTGGAKLLPRCRDSHADGYAARGSPDAEVMVSGPLSLRTPIAASCWASSASIGPPRPVRSRVGSPLSSSAQPPSHCPVAGFTCPLPTTRVARRASLPTTVRAKPVVSNLTVEAGTIGSDAFTDHSTSPELSAITTPHRPGADRVVWAYHEDRSAPRPAGPCAGSSAGIRRRAMAGTRRRIMTSRNARRVRVPYGEPERRSVDRPFSGTPEAFHGLHRSWPRYLRWSFAIVWSCMLLVPS